MVDVLMGIICILFIVINVAAGGEYCPILHYYEKEYCTFGCCYNGCCSFVGPISGIIIGMAAVVGIIIAIICCCRKTQISQGSIINTQPTVGYHSTTSVGASYQQPSGQTFIYPATQYAPYAQTGSQQIMYEQKSPVSTGYQEMPQPTHPSSYGYPMQQMPSGSHTELHETHRKSHIEPSAPPPMYDDLQKPPS